MASLAFTIVIPTYNRANMVGRAIESALAQQLALEIIVVDDASRDNTAEVVPHLYPQVRYLRQDSNKGPGAARNRGVVEASNPLVVMLDDDDTLLPGALELILERVAAYPGAADVPVFQFARSNGSIPGAFSLVTFDDYIHGSMQGDFVPVIQAKRFLALGFAYPDSRIGAEHLLWWRIALEYGIPTWDMVVCHLHTDAVNRLTSMDEQMHHARQHAQAQQLSLEEFGDVLKARAPSFYAKKRLGAATYWLLCGERERAREHLREPVRGSHFVFARLLWALSFMPSGLTHRLLVLYRRFGQ